MIAPDYTDVAWRALGFAGGTGSVDAVVDRIAELSALRRYWATVWAEPDGVLEQAWCDAVSRFATMRRSDVAAYLTGEQTFDAMTRSFIRHLFALMPSRVDPTKCLDELGLGRVAVKIQVEAALAGCWRPSASMKILGYGAGECGFEHDLGRHALTQGLADEYRIYRYDPFAAPASSVTDLDAAQLREQANAGMDLVTARWALHHVEPGSRWSHVTQCLELLAEGGHFVLVEQGDFADRHDGRVDRRLCRMLVMAIDVVANYTLRPTWFTRTSPELGADFHVDYLDAADLRAIEAGFAQPARRTVHPVLEGQRCGETVIVYHLGH